ncbi:unnamed protein product [Blepharisma stoltei]|uniref:Uncharacterized protein n=1 Tax=Blepharisma stoltei TaxID=1481888 RepID=A0AAU9J151_9CILI|nr:unnamed protein product [Blepharisma stoltei]
MDRSDSSTAEEELYIILKDALTSENKQIIDCYDKVFLRNLLNSSRENSMHMNISHEGRYIFKGYPSGNYIKQLAKVVALWSQIGTFPISFVNLTGFDTEITRKEIENLSTLSSLVVDLVSRLNDPAVPSLAENLLLRMGPRGVLTCLGVRRTQGSIDKCLPPSKSFLERAFSQLHTAEESKKSSLTVGARALTKHCHRSSDGFWGKISGTEVMKNAVAQQVLDRFFTNCVWINIHCLPNEEPVIEVRVQEGYGVRWLINKQQFRGFLEPQMEGGHERGWRH